LSKLHNTYHKTRIAPTPSGFLHLGNALSFAVTAALAQKNGAKILLRIDDLDRTRINQEYVQDVFDTLNFLEIPWEEGPRNVKEFEDSYTQVRRLALYAAALTKLRDNGHVFACTCTRSQLAAPNLVCTCFKRNIPLDTPNASWRLNTSDYSELAVKSYNGNVIKTAFPPAMHNFIVRKKDGFPAYQLTSVIDDLFYGVDLVVRGEDLWPSTLAQHAVAFALAETKFSAITFFHHPLLMEATGKKLSKSAGSTSIRYLRHSGHTSGDIYRLIAGMLGIDADIFSWEQFAGIVNSVY
jgi:glutamyl/glutaminyl-tRNA synthetase